MHFPKKNFFKKCHPITYSPGFSDHDGYLRNVLGLVCLYCDFFENGRGTLKISVQNPEDAPGQPSLRLTAYFLSLESEANALFESPTSVTIFCLEITHRSARILFLTLNFWIKFCSLWNKIDFLKKRKSNYIIFKRLWRAQIHFLIYLNRYL